MGRNVEIKFAKGDIKIFLDDDAIPAQDFVEKYITAYKYNIFGLRGKSLPRTPIIYNYLTSHYDLGDQIIHYVVNLKMSYKNLLLVIPPNRNISKDYLPSLGILYIAAGLKKNNINVTVLVCPIEN